MPLPDLDALAELRRWLAAVDAITTAVNSARNLHVILDLVAQHSRQLLGFDFCAVLLPDVERQNLVITGWSGLTAEYVARVNADRPVRLALKGAERESDLQEAPSSRAFRTGRPVAIGDIATEAKFLPWGGVAREQGYRAMVSVPLIAGEQALGTLNGYHAAVHDFTGDELERLTLLANHAAIALTSARMVDELQNLNGSLRQQASLLTRSEEVHRQLLSVALGGGGVQGILDVLSALVNRPVLLEDERGAVLGRVGPPDAQPDPGLRSGAVDRNDTRSAHLVVGADGGEHRMWAVQLEGELVARLWLSGAGEPAPIDQRAVEHALIVLSLELVRLRTALEVELRVRGELLSDILGGAAVDSRAVRDRLHHLGHDLSAPGAVTIVGRVTASDAGRQAVVEQRALTAVAELAARRRPRPLCGMYRGLLVAIWTAAAPPVDAGTAQSVPSPSDAAGAVRRSMAAVAGAGSATVATVRLDDAGDDHPRAYRTARGALEIGMRSGRSDTVIVLDDLGVSGLLLQLDDAGQLLTFADRTLAAVRQHDRDRGTALIPTLRSFLDHRQNRADTAAALHVHPNTVTQRLQRIQTLTGADLSDPDAVVALTTALTVLDVAASIHPG